MGHSTLRSRRSIPTPKTRRRQASAPRCWALSRTWTISFRENDAHCKTGEVSFVSTCPNSNPYLHLEASFLWGSADVPLAGLLISSQRREDTVLGRSAVTRRGPQDLCQLTSRKNFPLRFGIYPTDLCLWDKRFERDDFLLKISRRLELIKLCLRQKFIKFSIILVPFINFIFILTCA